MAPFVEFRDVSLVYGQNGQGGPDTFAIRDVTMNIARGEFVAIVGPSGCGKTSLLKLLSGLMLPSQGTVSVAGQKVNGPLKNVGMAFQNPIMLPWRTTLENVLLPLEIVQPHKAHYRKDPKPYVEKAHDLLSTVGLTGFEHHQPWKLSGGMQQRASLCRSLIHEPEILLMDEPFGALDAFTREELWVTLQKLWEKRRCTVILVTHDLREAVFLANTVYVMSKRPGQVVYRTEVDLSRPRTIEESYSDEFTHVVHRIRDQIGQVREV